MRLKKSVMVTGIAALTAISVTTAMQSAKGQVPPVAPHVAQADTVLSVKDVKPQLVGQEVTVRFRVVRAYSSSGDLAEKERPSIVLTPTPDINEPMFGVTVRGELAQIIDRLDISPRSLLEGREVEVTGTLRQYAPHPGVPPRPDVPQSQPPYAMVVSDWTRFQVLPLKVLPHRP